MAVDDLLSAATGGLIGGSPEAPQTVTVTEPAQSQEAEQNAEEEARRRQRAAAAARGGRRSSILTGATGAQVNEGNVRRSLLGGGG